VGVCNVIRYWQSRRCPDRDRRPTSGRWSRPPARALPALKPGIELTLAESEALADQASLKAPVETQPTTSQKAMDRTAGQAAKLPVTGMDVPLLTNADHLAGLSKSDVTKLFGPPAESKERPPSQIWTYHSAVCDVTMFFYPEVDGWALRALTYQIDQRGASDNPPRLSHQPGKAPCQLS
jgi:hypothetical protein